MFKGVSQFMPSVGVLYFGLFNPFECSPLPLYLPPHFSTAFSTHAYILYLHISWYAVLMMLYHSLLLSHLHGVPRVVALLQTCFPSYGEDSAKDKHIYKQADHIQSQM
jgi:hypothetical protein